MTRDWLADQFARLEGRHWLGLSASLVLHILVVLLFPLPESEPRLMTFEVALTPPPASQLPTPLSHKLSKDSNKARKSASPRTARHKRQADNLDLAWKRERQPRRDAPKVSLPDPQVAARAEEQPRLARPQAVKPSALAVKPAAEVVEPGLSDPGSGASGQVQAAQPGRDIGVALAVAQSLAMAPGRVSGGLTVQGAAQAASAQGTTGNPSGAAGTAMANSQQSGGTGVNAAVQGAGSRDGATSQAQSGIEAKGMRLSAASHLGGMAALTAAGTTVAAPLAGEAGRAIAADAARGAGFAASSGARAAASPQAGAAGGGRSGVAAGVTGDAGAGEVPSATRGGSATGVASLASSGVNARTQAPVPGREAGQGLGQTTRPEASAPAASGSSTVAAAGGSSRSGGAQSPVLAMAPGSAASGAGGGQKAAARAAAQVSSGGEVSTGGDAGGGRAVAASDGEGGRKQALQNTRVAASQLIRPDSEAQALDVLAPSTFCPLPGHQPVNRAPQTANKDPAKPGYAADNPSLYFPTLAMAYGKEGRVTVRVEVLPDGRTGQTLLKQSSGSSILDEDARNQLTRLRFTPVQRNGQAITSWIDVPVTYRLPNKQ